MKLLIEEVVPDAGPHLQRIRSINVPPSLASQFRRPDYSEVTEHHISRFRDKTKV